MPQELVGVRFIEEEGVRYLRAEDVAAYLRVLAATEPTDTRHRIETAAEYLMKDWPPVTTGTRVALPVCAT